eukprot:tig00001335_g8213.t1
MKPFVRSASDEGKPANGSFCRPVSPGSFKIAGPPASPRPSPGAPATDARVWFALSSAGAGFFVPASLLPHASRIWECFRVSPEGQARVPAAGQQPAPRDAEFVSFFLDAVRAAGSFTEPVPEAARARLAGEALAHLQRTLLGFDDIHGATQGMASQADVVRNYFWAREFAARAPEAAASLQALQQQPPLASHLLAAAEDGDAGLFLDFNGQGYAFLPELKEVYETYAFARPFVGALLEAVREESAGSNEMQLTPLCGAAVDGLAWLEGREAAPAPDALACAPVSYPLTFVTQMAHYYVALRLSRRQAREFLALFRGATGHSQGLVAAAVAAASPSEGELLARASAAARAMFWTGLRAHVAAAAFPRSASGATPMLSVRRLPLARLEAAVERANRAAGSDPARRLEVRRPPPEPRPAALRPPRGGADRAGQRPAPLRRVRRPAVLERLLEDLRAASAAPGAEQARPAPPPSPPRRRLSGPPQNRVPFSKRKPELEAAFLPVSAPFHSAHLAPAAAAVAEDAARCGLALAPGELLLPLYSTLDGSDLRSAAAADLVPALVDLQLRLPLRYERALAACCPARGASHLVSFGPGEATLAARLKRGSGVAVLSAAALAGRAALLGARPSPLAAPAPHWGREFAPHLVRLPDGTFALDTKFTRALGKPPLMMAGMTPCTVAVEPVAACLNAGYHGELAGGGLHTPEIFRAALLDLAGRLRPGDGVTINLLFLNPYLWGFQFPAIESMLEDGTAPIDGICIGAGVPSLEKATEILTRLRERGLRHVAFKPGNAAAVRAVVEIAQANPESTVLLQWTGGRAGGHHSFEDAYEPVLETYALMRSCENLVLVAGSGVGDGESAWHWLSGEWSARLGYPAMPFDACLLASRLCACAEMQSPPETKARIAATPGIENEADWEKSYEGEAGGIITVTSELGEPIHVVANRAMLLWRELDREVFGAPKERAEAFLRDRRQHIVDRLNADFAKVYFCRKADGSTPELADMTYAEVAQRMAEVMTFRCSSTGEERWIDETYRTRFVDWLQRVEARFAPAGAASRVSREQTAADPRGAVEAVLSHSEGAAATALAAEDVDYFLELCRRPGKPVNFVPAIDKDLKLWFKKDSLFYSERLEWVPNRDVERTQILLGPVAARHIKRANEPIGEVFDSIHADLLRRTREAAEAEAGPEAACATVHFVGGPAVEAGGEAAEAEAQGVAVRFREDSAAKATVLEATVPPGAPALPRDAAWLDLLAGGRPSWLRALLTAPHLVRGTRRVANPLARVFRPRPGVTAVVSRSSATGVPSSLALYSHRVENWGTGAPAAPAGLRPPSPAAGGASPLDRPPRPRRGPRGVRPAEQALTGAPAVEARLLESGRIQVTLHHARLSADAKATESVPLALEYEYRPAVGFAPLLEVVEGRAARVTAFYRRLWLSAEPDAAAAAARARVERPDVARFCRAVGLAPREAAGRALAPLDFAAVAGWDAMMRPVLREEAPVDVARLVHLSNEFEALEARALRDGDAVRADFRLVERTRGPTGTTLAVKGTLHRLAEDGAEVPCVAVASAFFVRASGGEEADPAPLFREAEARSRVELPDAKAAAVLLAQPWLKAPDPARLAPGPEPLLFELASVERHAPHPSLGSVAASVRAAGSVSRGGAKVAEVAYEGPASDAASPLAYLARCGAPADEPRRFESGGYSLLAAPVRLRAPGNNSVYSAASRDHNPIHNNPFFADLAGLPDTIVHGMWSSAQGRRVLEQYVCAGRPERLRRWRVEFVDMVMPREELTVTARHVGMRDGRMVVEVAVATAAEGRVVMKGAAELEQPRTAYIFTGQGSASQGMGMDLYESSPVAKEVWDRGDRHLRAVYGVSILEIVRGNPTELTVHFGGKRGRALRESYLALKRYGEENGLPLFAGLDERSDSYTYRAPEGLLFATQFQQPAILLYDSAVYCDLRARGLVPSDLVFAGHSLGEYGALATAGGAFEVELLVETTYLRGATMQSAVARDAQGRSPYGMVACNPSRVGKHLTEAALEEAVEAVAAASGHLLQVVNFNVRDLQYVAAGTRLNLAALGALLDQVKRMGALPASMRELAAAAVKAVAEKHGADPYVQVERGQATIPLAGIDVPFHSRLLRGGVPAFRRVLSDRLGAVKAERLHGRFVPNLTGRPFRLELDYVKELLAATESPVLAELVPRWEAELAARGPDALARTVLVECMAYQFASPVRWIDTQEVLFAPGPGGLAVERVVEVGPARTLVGMAKQTLAAAGREAELLWCGGDRDAIAFAFSDPAPKEEAKPAPAAAAPAPAPAPAAALAPARPRAAKSIKDYCGGKSAIQNEIVGDLEKEFGGPLGDGSAEAPIEQLAGRGPAATYKALGRVTSGWVARLIGAKMPAGFGAAQVKAHLSGRRLLGEGRAACVQLYALTMEPAARLASEAEAAAFWDAACDAYGAAKGVAVPVAGAGGAAGGEGAGGATMVDGRALEAFRKQQADILAEQIAALQSALRSVKGDGGAKAAAAEAPAAGPTAAQLANLAEEMGGDFVEAVRPMFDANRERRYDSAWNWARADAFALFNAVLLGEVDPSAPEQAEKVRAAVHGLVNRACPELLEYARACAARRCTSGSASERAAVELFRRVAERVEGALEAPPRYREFERPTAPEVDVAADGRVVYREAPREGVESPADYVREMRRGHAGTPFVFLKRKAGAGAGGRALCPAATDAYLGALDEIAREGFHFGGKWVLVNGCGKGSIAYELLRMLLAAGARVVACAYADPTRNGGRGLSAAQHAAYRALFREHGARGAELHVVPFNGASVQDCHALVKYVYETLKADVDVFVPFAAVPEGGRDIAKIDARSEVAHRVMLTNTVRLIGLLKAEKEARGVSTRPAHVVLPLSPNHGLFGGDGLYSESKIGLEVLLEKWASEGWSDYVTLSGAVIGWTRGTGLMNANNWTAAAFEKEGARTFAAWETALNLLGLLHPAVVRLAEEEPVWADLGGGFDRIADLANFTKAARRAIEERSAAARAVAEAARPPGPAPAGPAPASRPGTKARPDYFATFPKLPSARRLQRLKGLRGLVDLERTVVVTGFGEVGPFGSARTRWEFEADGGFSIAGCIELAWLMGLIKYHSGPLPGTGRPYTGWLDAKTKEPVGDFDVKAKYEGHMVEHTGIRVVEGELLHGMDPSRKEFLRQVAVERDLPPVEIASAAEAEQFTRAHGDKVEVWQEPEGGAWRARLKRGAVLYVPKATVFDRFVAGQVPSGWNAAAYGIPPEIVAQVDPVCLYALVSAMDALAGAGVVDPYELYQYVHPSEVGNAVGGGMGGLRNLRRIFLDRRLETPMQSDSLQETFINTVPAWINMLLLSSCGPIKTPVGACATAAQSVEVGAETILAGKAKVMLVGGYDDFIEETSYEFAQMKATCNCAEDAARGREPREMSRPTTHSRAGFVEAHGAGVQVLMAADLAIRMGAPIYGVVALARTASDREGRSVPAPGQGILSFAREDRAAAAAAPIDVDARRAGLRDARRAAHEWRAAQLRPASPAASLSSPEPPMTPSGSRPSSPYEGGAPAGEPFEAGLGPCPSPLPEGRVRAVQEAASRLEKAAARYFGSGAALEEPGVSPLRAALAVFGLTPDDIGVASLHGTSTKANDKNEFMVLHKTLEHLGRQRGRPVPVICQKWLTGHPKGGAAAWMLNGLLQAMASGVIPGNRNADNVAPELRPYTHLMAVDRTLRVPASSLRAGLLTSFGFGQAGAEILLVAPEYLLASLQPAALAEYAAKREARLASAVRFHHEALAGKRPFVAVKTAAPYHADDMHDVFLDPSARAAPDRERAGFAIPRSPRPGTPGDRSAFSPASGRPPLPRKGSASRPETPVVSVTEHEEAEARRLRAALEAAVAAQGPLVDAGVGVDVEPIATFQDASETMLERNFTAAELEHCEASSDAPSRLAGKWAAKEAVAKALSSSAPDSAAARLRGSAAPLNEIEILPSPSGAPQVRLHGYAREVAAAAGVAEVVVSISHAGDYAVAHAVARCVAGLVTPRPGASPAPGPPLARQLHFGPAASAASPRAFSASPVPPTAGSVVEQPPLARGFSPAPASAFSPVRLSGQQMKRGLLKVETAPLVAPQPRRPAPE